jgi:hypothetical protein
VNSVYSTNWKDQAKRSLFFPQIQKIKAERTWLIPEIGKIKAKKMNWVEVKRTEAVFLKLLWSPGIDSEELIPPAYALADLYYNPIPVSILLTQVFCRRQHFVDTTILSTLTFCLHEHFVDAIILLPPMFCRRQYSFDAANCCAAHGTFRYFELCSICLREGLGRSEPAINP